MRNVMEVTFENETYQVKSSFENSLDILNIISMLVTKFKSTANDENQKYIAEALLVACMQGRTFSSDENGEIYISEEAGEIVDDSED